jgi:hypothetical protein
MIFLQGKPKYSEKTCPSATLSTTNPTWINPGLRGERPATNRLSHGTAPLIKLKCDNEEHLLLITFKGLAS